MGCRPAHKQLPGLPARWQSRHRPRSRSAAVSIARYQPAVRAGASAAPNPLRPAAGCNKHCRDLSSIACCDPSVTRQTETLSAPSRWDPTAARLRSPRSGQRERCPAPAPNGPLPQPVLDRWILPESVLPKRPDRGQSELPAGPADLPREAAPAEPELAVTDNYPAAEDTNSELDRCLPAMEHRTAAAADCPEQAPADPGRAEEGEHPAPAVSRCLREPCRPLWLRLRKSAAPMLEKLGQKKGVRASL